MPRDRCRPPPGEPALSDTIAEILIVILSVALVMVVAGTVTGLLPRMLQQSALIAVKAEAVTTSSGADVISLYHRQGLAVSIDGSAQAGGSAPVSFTLTAPDGVNVRVRNASAIRENAWAPGGRVFLFQEGGYYYVTDDPEWLGSRGPAVSIPPGTWKVNIADARLNLLLQTLPVTIG